MFVVSKGNYLMEHSLPEAESSSVGQEILHLLQYPEKLKINHLWVYSGPD
jgi:hypothetical protein